MTRVRPLEIKALVPLLNEEWEDAESLAEALVRALDESRASRTSYVGVMQFGPPRMDGATWYYGVGPYPGRKAAERALKGDPSASLASALVVIPMTSPEGLEAKIQKCDEKRKTA